MEMATAAAARFMTPNVRAHRADEMKNATGSAASEDSGWGAPLGAGCSDIPVRNVTSNNKYDPKQNSYEDDNRTFWVNIFSPSKCSNDDIARPLYQDL